MTYTFTTPAYTIETDAAGYDTVNLEGFYPYALPGDPLLPASLTNLALPPLVPLESVSIEIVDVQQTDLPGTYNIAPAGPALAAPDGSEPIENWGPNAATIEDGRNVAVYGRGQYFPAAPVELVSASQMRKWRYVTLRYFPLSYNPMTRGLRLTTQVTVAIHFQTATYQALSLVELNDTAFDEQAAEILANYDDVESAYTLETRAATSAAGYAIITTNQIASASSQLTNFINHKASLGFNVMLVTETQYNGLTGQAPNERPDKIRKWLQNNYLTQNIQYVLLIGSPDPLNPLIGGDVAGDLPMKMTYPMSTSELDYVYPTDHYFADLTGNWNKDGDNWYADSGDFVAGGVDFAADVYVGRIPVYTSVSGWATTLDDILLKTKNYELSTDRAWRRSALLAMAFLGVGSDGAVMGEYMRNDYLLGAGFGTYRQYFHDSSTLCTSIYPSEGELANSSVVNRWKDNPYGIVVMFGHGGPAGITFGYNGCADWMHSISTGMIGSGNAPLLNPARPAMVFQASCSSGQPDRSDNLGAAILNRGGIGTIAGSNTTWGWGGTPSPGDTSHSSFPYYYMKSIINDATAGRALFAAKATPTDRKNALAYNLYGDPSVRLNAAADNDNTMANARLMQVNDVVSGGMNNNGDVDFFKFYISQHATPILIDTDAQSLVSAMDTIVTLYDAAGNEVATNDDQEYYDFDSLLYRTLNPGWWYVKVRDLSGRSGPNYFYELNVSAPLLISSTVAGTVSGIAFQPGDIMAWSKLNTGAEKWVMFFDASDVGFVANINNVSRAWVGQTNGRSIAVSFAANQNVVDFRGVSRTVKPWDWIVLYLDQVGPETSIGGIEYHAGTGHSLSTTAEKLDALSIWDWWTLQRRVDVGLSTTGTASVPRTGGVLKPADEDMFRSRVTCDGCAWVNSAFFDGSRVAGLAVEDVFAASYFEPSNDMYLTILGNGTIAKNKVTQKDIFRVDLPGHTWGGLVWRGPDHGWNVNIDAIDYPGGW